MQNNLLLSATKIDAHLTNITRTLISNLDIFLHIDSTNTYLMNHIQHHEPASGWVCFAEQQTAGKGRRGKEWISPQGQNIYGSFLWRFSSATALNGLSLAIGVGVIRVLNNNGIFNVGLKWPNDIYSNGKKLGGILVEVTTHSNGSASIVVGLGLNLDLSQNITAITQPYTTLCAIAPDKKFERNIVIAQLLNELLPIAATFEKQGLSAYLEEWRRYDYLLGKSVTLFVGIIKVSGIVEGIDTQGLLILRCENGSVQSFSSGEVSFNT